MEQTGTGATGNIGLLDEEEVMEKEEAVIEEEELEEEAGME